MSIYKERVELLASFNQRNAGNHNDVIMAAGAKLSKEIGCPVIWPAFDHDTFMCKCGISFPVYAVEAEMWEAIKQKHETGE